MGLDNFLKQTAKETNQELAKLIPKQINEKDLIKFLGAPDFDFDLVASQKAIVTPLWDFLDRGGKRWRPALMLLSCQAVGGNKKQVLPFLPIPELVHNGTIVVDDVEDSSRLRRGKPALHLVYGVDVAINVGNAMYYLPLVSLFENKELSFETKEKIYRIYSLEMIRLSFGQAMDIQWHNGGTNVTEKKYLQMCSYKTGSLARMAAKLGAIIGGASEEQTNALGEFATCIGVAFQIQDDILNIKPELNWGKETGDDINEGKRTLMVIHAFSILPKEKKKRLEQILDSSDNSKQEIKEAISILESTDSINYAKFFLREFVSKKWATLEEILPDSESKTLLKEFADYVIKRSI